MTRESKFIVASNLTVAAVLRDKMFMDKKIDPGTDSKDAIMQLLSDFVNLLDKKYPEQR